MWHRRQVIFSISFAPLQLEGQQQIEWDGVGAQRITQWSTEVIPDEVKQQSHAVFLGMGNTDIRSRGFVQSATQLRVEVASYELAVIDKNHIVGLARFDVLPTRGSDLSLVWPEMWVLEEPLFRARRWLPSNVIYSPRRVNPIPELSFLCCRRSNTTGRYRIYSGQRSKACRGSNLTAIACPRKRSR